LTRENVAKNTFVATIALLIDL